MDENEMSFNENQLRRVGADEAFTPDVIKQMQDGAPVIQKSFVKDFEGGTMEGTLHLKKSQTSDHYFMNKIDAMVQKIGEDFVRSQTFYLSSRRQPDGDNKGEQIKVENRYTLKAIYNALQGRPIGVLQTTKDGDAERIWERINFNKRLENGNHEVKRHYPSYGFDLDKTLANYSIKEMRNEQYADSLKYSLYRGNLQKAAFIDKDGYEEKLYVSPNISLGSMNVYDENKKRVPDEKLVEKGYISQEFAQQLKERIAEINRELRPERQQQKEAAKQKEIQKQEVKQKKVPKHKVR